MSTSDNAFRLLAEVRVASLRGCSSGATGSGLRTEAATGVQTRAGSVQAGQAGNDRGFDGETDHPARNRRSHRRLGGVRTK